MERDEVTEELSRDSTDGDGTGAMTKPPTLSVHGSVEDLEVFRVGDQGRRKGGLGERSEGCGRRCFLTHH